MSNEFDEVKHQAELKGKSDAEIAAELAQLELDMKRYQVVIMKEQSEQIKAKHRARLEEAESKARSTIQFLFQREAQQRKCNHRKGGFGAPSVIQGEGTSAMYCLIKHLMPTNTWWVSCTRCAKEWNQEFRVSGILLTSETPGFQEAVRLATDNTPSRSGNFQFHIDDPKAYLEAHPEAVGK